MRDVTDSYLDPDLEPKRRVCLIWRGLFFLHIWRAWLLQEGYKLSDNFVTNAHACVELNAHAMIRVIRYLRLEGRPDLFVPPLFSSQTCEKFYRTARSMTTTFVTMVNFNMLQFLQRLRRIELLTHVAAVLGEEFKFPR